jgi:hypothetical protein
MVQRLGGIPSSGVKNQKSAPSVTGGVFYALHERPADPLASSASVHQQLHYFGPMPCVLHRGHIKLYRSQHLVAVKRNKEDAGSAGNRSDHGKPVRPRIRRGQGWEESHRSPAVNGVL